jgi:7-keto-8-aminopelargonate synthetase-like enzyme
MPEQGALATMVEFPAVAEGCARFRLQVMAGHELEQTQKAAQ